MRSAIEPPPKEALQPSPPALQPSPPALRRLASQVQTVPGRVLIGLVQLYRLALSPVLAPSCRYWPSCSEYAIEALRRHGAARGSWLATRRLCRCHPWAAGGIDEVPPNLTNPANPANLASPANLNTRWRAYLGEPHRDTSDTASS